MSINEIVLISGKGGTGKTSLTASIIPYLDQAVVADCDVDAPDLHILLNPELSESLPFSGTGKAEIDSSLCKNCGICLNHCQFHAISEDLQTNGMKCEGCGVCEYLCPAGAISLNDALVGTVYKGNSPYGPMVYARLIPGEETSGKLVSQVRKEAREKAQELHCKTVLIDGSPGIGCNVISSITGAAKVIIVSEPTMSGLHDLKRVLDVSERFSGKSFVVINKCDLSEEMCRAIEKESERRNVPVILKLPFNRNMVKAIAARKIPSLAEEDFFLDAQWKKFIRVISD